MVRRDDVGSEIQRGRSSTVHEYVVISIIPATGSIRYTLSENMLYKLSGYLHASIHPNYGGIHDNERNLMEEIARTRRVSLTAT